MMIAIPKSTMSNNKFIAGLFFMLIMSTSDVFADTSLINISFQPNNHSEEIIKHNYLNSIPSVNFLQKKINFIEEVNKEDTSFYSLSQFFDNNQSKPYISDGVKFISSKSAFIDLGVDLNETALFIKHVGQIYDSILSKEINDMTKENKMIIVKVQISSKNSRESSCSINCSNNKISFHSTDKFGTQITEFSKLVRNFPFIKITNPQSSSVAEFHIYLNTKPKNFIVRENSIKRPLIKISPFYNMG